MAKYNIGETVIINFSWSDYRLNHKLTYGKVTSVTQVKETYSVNGKPYRPIITEATTPSGKVYTETPSSKTSFMSLDVFKVQMELIENNIANEAADFKKLSEMASKIN